MSRKLIESREINTVADALSLSRTHMACVERDSTTGRKFINQYEVIEEIGRGVHGKVKLARILDTNENVAIKIIPRFSKTRRLGKVTAKSPVDKTKREIAILKKVRHPNVVALLEVIDDPELKKIYMVLEHVELGEIVWRKKGLPHICHFERRRIEREIRGEAPSEEEIHYTQILERRQAIKDMKRARLSTHGQLGHIEEPWSFEAGAAIDDEADPDILSRSGSSRSISSRIPSRTPSRVHSLRAMSRSSTPQPIETIEEDGRANIFFSDLASSPAAVLEGTMFGTYADDSVARDRSPSMADSIISHMSSIDLNPQSQDVFSDDYSYVPCFTMAQARSTFRDTVLGLEYLHYQGIIHRDIKPANLLWTRDHRVKISDFGVSYFGRPIREGEPDEPISESEAYDFDDELELAKTVGTPAFFAPELCYTDLDQEPPKISEQIDVWSLGVTLYCLIFARLPFLAEDEFQMFKKIATEEVYIPKRRLRPVDPATSSSSTSFHKKGSLYPYRDDNELVYEETDDVLRDLLRRMLVKNPGKRIRLQEVKRHPWVVEGIPPSDLMKWIDETDPRRQAQGQRIQVDEREMNFAVIPLTLFERAKSVVKKTYNKMVHGRAEGFSRRRATSSVASSAGDSSYHLPQTPHVRDRRRSLKPDDYFTPLKDAPSSEHPLPQSQSMAASPRGTLANPAASQQYSEPVCVPRRLNGPEIAIDGNLRTDVSDHTTTAPSTTSSSKSFQKHGYARSITNAILSLAPTFLDSEPAPPSPSSDTADRNILATVRKSREIWSYDESSRARSVDRGLFYNESKYIPSHVSLSTTMGPGSVQFRRPRPMRSIDLEKAAKSPQGQPSPLLSSPRTLPGSHSHPKSDPSIYAQHAGDFEGRPMTAHRIEDIPEGRTVPLQRCNYSISDSSKMHEGSFMCRTEGQRMEPIIASHHSLRRDTYPEHNRVLDNIVTIKSSSSNSFGAITSPMTTPFMTNPVHAPARENTESMQVFQSDPSLPALLSGASSISADAEGEFLARPGMVQRSLIDTTDSLTPPAIVKESSTQEFPLDRDLENHRPGSLQIEQFSLRRSVISPKLPSRRKVERDSESDSDSDDGFLMMGKGKGKAKKKASNPHTHAIRRRDTSASIGSTETAKKVRDLAE